MYVTCIKLSSDVYTPPNGEPIPMFKLYCEHPDSNDLLKIQISQKNCVGSPAPGKIYVDFGPRYGSGGKLYWKPNHVKFCKEGE